MEAEVFIHIGIGKTGTTSIQEMLSRNRDRLLSEGILYPKAGTAVACGAGHHNFFTLEGPLHEAEFVALAAELKELNPKKVLISSENLCYASPPVIRRMADVFGGRAKIVIYVRRQTDLIESTFLQWQKTGREYQGDIRSFFFLRRDTPEGEEMQVQKGLDFMLRISPWADVFGADNIIARAYHSKVIGSDVCEDFMRLVGVRPSAWENIGEYLNTSILPEFSALISLIDGLSPPPAVRSSLISEILNASVKLKRCSTTKLIDPALRQEIVAYYAGSNLMFAKAYLPKEQWDSFLFS